MYFHSVPSLVDELKNDHIGWRFQKNWGCLSTTKEGSKLASAERIAPPQVKGQTFIILCFFLLIEVFSMYRELKMEVAVSVDNVMLNKKPLLSGFVHFFFYFYFDTAAKNVQFIFPYCCYCTTLLNRVSALQCQLQVYAKILLFILASLPHLPSVKYGYNLMECLR